MNKLSHKIYEAFSSSKVNMFGRGGYGFKSLSTALGKELFLFVREQIMLSLPKGLVENMEHLILGSKSALSSPKSQIGDIYTFFFCHT